MSNSSTWPLNRVLSGVTILCQSGFRYNGNKEEIHIPKSSIITGASLLDCFVSYLEHSLRRSYPSQERKSVYFTTPVNWAAFIFFEMFCYFRKNIVLKKDRYKIYSLVIEICQIYQCIFSVQCSLRGLKKMIWKASKQS